LTRLRGISGANRIVHLEPLIVRGFFFKAKELVRVKGFVAEAQVARSVRANLFGTFSIDVGRDVHLAGCSAGAFLKATGSLGSVAVLKIPPRLCAPLAAG